MAGEEGNKAPNTAANKAPNTAANKAPNTAPNTTPAGDAKPAATGRLTLTGAVKIRTRTPGCEDINTALNTPLAERKATEGDEIMGSGDSAKLGEWLKNPTCQFFGGRDPVPGGSSYATLNAFEVQGTTLPPLPSGKIAFCVAGMYIVNPNTPQTRCHWVIVSPQDVPNDRPVLDAVISLERHPEIFDPHIAASGAPRIFFQSPDEG